MNEYFNVKDKAEKGGYDPKMPPYPKRDQEKLVAWRKKKDGESRRLKAEFKEDCRKEFEIDADNPKWEKCFELAWEHGHSAGYHEVLGYLDDLVELIRPE